MNFDNVIFLEIQKINMIWLWIIIAFIVILMWVIAYRQLILHKKVGSHPGPNSMVFIFWIIFGILLPIFVFTSDIRTILTEEEIHIQSTNRILVNEYINYPDIADYKYISYHPIIQFGGWGNRGNDSKKIYSVGGHKAIQLTLTDGNIILIGTEQGETITHILDDML